MKEDNNSRRKFLQNVSAVGALTLIAPKLMMSKEVERSKRIPLVDNDIILFQGDSITDADRKRDDEAPNTTSILGTGYALLAASALLRNHPGKNLNIFNRGISGNKVFQLAKRWQKDCIAIKPTVLSILVGVNDFWHKHKGFYDGDITVYRDSYRKLIQETIKEFPGIKLIIGEPFAINGVKEVDDSWFPDFYAYQKASFDLSQEFGAVFIPYQKIFNKAIDKASADYWTTDGVHPTVAGTELMAEAWLNAVR